MEGTNPVMQSIIGHMVAREAESLGLTLSACEIEAFDRYADELKKWNRKVNLTSITKDQEIAIKHFVDSLSLVPYITAGVRLLDIGSGAGLPVIPLKILRPDVPMVSVDAVAKKIHFQRHIIRVLNLQNMEAVHARIEDLHKTESQSFNVITSRAFTRLDRFVSLAGPLLADDGMMIAMKGDQADDEIASSDDILQAAGFTVTSIVRYTLPFGMGGRVLTCIQKSKAL